MQKVPPYVKVVKAEQKGWRRGLQSHLEPKHPNLTAQSACPHQGNHSWDPCSASPAPADSLRVEPNLSEVHQALRAEAGQALNCQQVLSGCTSASSEHILLFCLQQNPQTKSCFEGSFHRIPGWCRAREGECTGNGRAGKPRGLQVKQCLCPGTQGGADSAPERGKAAQGVQGGSQELP